MKFERNNGCETRKSSVPRVAVCLAAYNGMSWLERQIETILGQKYVDVTVFVSVDISTDGTWGYVAALAEMDARIKLLPYGQRFGGAAKNFFRLLAEVDFGAYEFVALSDQDDIWRETKLSRAVSVLESRRADAYSCNVTAFWHNGRQVLVDKSQPQRDCDYLFEAAGPGCTYVIRSSLVCEIKRCLLLNSRICDEIGLHDWFIYAFARSRKFQWVIDEFDGMLYRQHSSNQVGINYGLRAYVFRAKKVLGGWGLRQAYLIAQAVGLEDDPFVCRWKKMGRKELLWLAFQYRKCRRRRRDQVFFFLLCIGLATWRPKVE